MAAPGGQDEPGGGTQKWSRELGPFLTLGLQLAITVVAFFFLGRWVDQKLGTEPWLMLVGLVIGVVGGFLKFFRVASRLGKEADRNASHD
jgi:F0F1-type ATP synthase assembly protein I